MIDFCKVFGFSSHLSKIDRFRSNVTTDKYVTFFKARSFYNQESLLMLHAQYSVWLKNIVLQKWETVFLVLMGGVNQANMEDLIGPIGT